MVDRVRIGSDLLSAEIAHLGAELQSLTDRNGVQFMSSGDPAFWAGRAPLLFPIVGRLNGDNYRLDGASYELPQHGFARRLPFVLVAHDSSSATFLLTDTPGTRAAYPFPFEMEARFTIDELTIQTCITIRNVGQTRLPASFGFHPAFAWPLAGGAARSAHRIIFEHDEPAPLCRITPDGYIGPMDRPTPVRDRIIELSDDLFDDGALVWTDLKSRRLTYGAESGPALQIAFPDTDRFALWTKRGAAFICIEPWAGMADPVDYAGQFRDKPGVFEIEPNAERSFRLDITIID